MSRSDATVSMRACFIALAVAAAVFVVAGVRNRGQCLVRSAESASDIVMVEPSSAPSSTFAVRITPRGLHDLYGIAWVLEERAGGGWKPRWRLVLSGEGGHQGRVADYSDPYSGVSVALSGRRTVRLPLPRNIDTGQYRLRVPFGATDISAVLDVTCVGPRL